MSKLRATFEVSGPLDRSISLDYLLVDDFFAVTGLTSLRLNFPAERFKFE